MFGGRFRFFARRGALLRAAAGMLLALLAACGGAPAAPATGAATPAAGAATPAAGTGASAGTPQPGGTMSVAYQNDIATLDPAIGYDWNNWPMEKMVFDALMDYDQGTTLIPQLAAEMPKINADATVYTFKLRPGVKFQNGRELNADDVVYSITRVIDPTTKSPGQGFFLTIKGAQELADGKATSVAGIKKLDPFIAINTTVKPFDNLKVRQAVNMAIDKNQIVKLMNGRAQVAKGILPPLMPGYDPNIKGYDYSVDKAKALLAEAGFPDGFKTSITCISVDPEPKVCESFQTDLKKIGVELEIRSLANSTVIADASTPEKTPLTWSGQLAWTQDYPDPADFYGPILSCSSAQPGGWNWSWYCNKDLDDQANKALGMQDKDARLKAYQQIFQKLMDDAVWVPVYHLEQYIGHSDALHGDLSDFLHPVHTFMYERLWKK